MNINILQEHLTDAQTKIMDDLLGVFAENKLDTNLRSNILISLLAHIFDTLPVEDKVQYRENLFAAFDDQCAYLASQTTK